MLLSTGAQAHGHRHHHHRHAHHAHHHAHAAPTAPTETGGGMAVIRAATGATALVARDVAGKFQQLVSALEAAGARIRDMGGLSHRRIAGTGTWSKHSVGHAIDICQLERNVVERGCHLPASATRIAASLGLTHGAVWGNPDTGHFEVRGPNPGSGGHAYASRRHHGGTRYAHARTEQNTGTW